MRVATGQCNSAALRWRSAADDVLLALHAVCVCYDRR